MSQNCKPTENVTEKGISRVNWDVPRGQVARLGAKSASRRGARASEKKDWRNINTKKCRNDKKEMIRRFVISNYLLFWWFDSVFRSFFNSPMWIHCLRDDMGWRHFFFLFLENLSSKERTDRWKSFCSHVRFWSFIFYISSCLFVVPVDAFASCVF